MRQASHQGAERISVPDEAKFTEIRCWGTSPSSLRTRTMIFLYLSETPPSPSHRREHNTRPRNHSPRSNTQNPRRNTPAASNACRARRNASTGTSHPEDGVAALIRASTPGGPQSSLGSPADAHQPISRPLRSRTIGSPSPSALRPSNWVRASPTTSQIMPAGSRY